MNSCTSVSQTHTHGNSKNEIRQRNKLEGDESIDKSKAGTKEKRSLDGLNYPNESTIILNILLF